MDASYPRDMIGYGRDPPDPGWPGDARLALQFVINYEEGGERCILHGDVGHLSLISFKVGNLSNCINDMLSHFCSWGRLTQSCTPWNRPPLETISSVGISECTMPAPAVIH